ncbi:MAG: hypothetical protein WD426_02960 [Anditalea sp.]
MKRLLSEYMEVENGIPAKALLPAEGLESKVLSAPELCAAEAVSLLDGAEMSLPAPAKAPMLLFFAFLILPWMLVRMPLQNWQAFPAFHYSIPPPVPIYLKLGRLIYYS